MSGAVKEEWCVGWGWWQARLAALLALPVLLTGAYGTNYVFLAAPTAYRCQVPECEGNSSGVAAPGQWAPAWAQWALPDGEPCKRWRPLDGACTEHSFDNTTTLACDAYIYQSGSSIVSEFNLACEEWKRSLVGTVHNVGMLISLPIMGFVSDKWGRRAALMVSGCGAGLAGLGKSFVAYRGDTNALPASKKFYDTLFKKPHVVALWENLGWELIPNPHGTQEKRSREPLLIEWLGVEHRILASLVLGIPLSLGAASLSLLDYLTGYWRFWARVAYPPSLLLLLYPWILPESVRWLATQGRFSEAVQVIKKAAKYNGTKVPEESLEKMLLNERESPGGSSSDVNESLFKALVKYGGLRRRLAVCFVWWVCAVFVFYGLAVRAHALRGSAHANYALVAAAELPALVLNTLLLDRVGRRPLLTAAFLLTAAAFMALPWLPEHSHAGWGTGLYLAGKTGATMALNALYVYTAELFPTRARHRLLAACSTLGRLGAILAPLTPLLAAYGSWVPTALFGALPLLSASLTPLVPDTLHRRLPDSFADLDSTAAILPADV
ncbi:hypothetical protein K1T71_001543 [Dendrolimus kikuchii]|uniref:Uncharacterized protein n=1 Tax=Dendrolimus kikuchii TaxID=765133 RepID=A0ACC1DIX4_9NEOP|nr:hypothetical protein K1T71_001543 [Dendrolimus kikuchii]